MQHGSVMEDQGDEIEMVGITKMVYFGKKEHVWQMFIVTVCIDFVLVLAE